MRHAARTARRPLLAEASRARAIASVFVRHGFGDIVQHVPGVGRVSWRPFGTATRARDNGLTRERRLRLAFEELGPTFIKFGQMLSVRSDLFPLALTSELAALQDHVPPLPPGAAEALVEQALKRPLASLFRTFEAEPIGSASIAQVHRAELLSGEPVAVKVRRPGLAGQVEGDLLILDHLAVWLDQHVADLDLYDLPGLVTQFARTIRLEQDLAREGRLIERFAGQAADRPDLVFPRVYWDYTQPAVLTMEYVAGLRLSDVFGPAGAACDRALLARRGADAVLEQVLVHGLFHADPHPGNILVLPDNRLCLLDFGIVGRLDRATRDTLLDLIHAVAHDDPERVADLLLILGEPLVEPDRRELIRDLAELLDSYAGSRLMDLAFVDLWRQLSAVISRHRLRLPSDLMLLIKALLTIEAVGRQLDPTFCVMQHAAPFVDRLLRERLAPHAVAVRLQEAARRAAGSARALPRVTASLLAKANDDRLVLQIAHRDLDPLARAIAVTGARLAIALVIGAALIAVALAIRLPAVSLSVGWWTIGALIAVAVLLPYALTARWSPHGSRGGAHGRGAAHRRARGTSR